MRTGIRFLPLLLLAAGMSGCSSVSSRARDFYGALQSGDIARVNVMVADGADINSYYGPCRLTPLHIASDRGYKDMAAFLIAKSADVNAAQESSFETPLHLAAKEGHVDIARLLLDNGADTEANERNGTPLRVAAYKNRPDVARLLIARGANVKAADHLGATPLHECAPNGSVSIAGMLLEAGAEVDAPMQSGITPLYYAACMNKTDLAEVLIENGADVNAKVLKEGFTALHRAAESGYDLLVTILVKNGADLNAHAQPSVVVGAQVSRTATPPTYNGTALHMAAEHGRFHTFKLLREFGADDMRIREDGKTPCEAAQARLAFLEERLKSTTKDARVEAERNLAGCKAIVDQLCDTRSERH